jgi:hypothetical protein
MKRTKLGAVIFVAPMALAMLIGLFGCIPVDYGGPEWDGRLGYYDGYYGGYDHGHAFRHDGGDREGERGRASLGARGGSGGHFDGGAGHSGGGGGHSGGGGGGGHR